MRLNYPSDERFSFHNFAEQPLTIIEQALEAIAQKELEFGNLIATPISRAMLYVLASKGVKNPERELKSINPYGSEIQAEFAKKTYSREFCQTFVELLKEGKIPHWVIGVVDVESISLVGK